MRIQFQNILSHLRWSLCFILPLIFCYCSLAQAEVNVHNVAELQNAISQANSGGDPTISIAAGTYNLNGVYLRITANNITVKGATGTAADVILDGQYTSSEIFQIVASNVHLLNLTLKRALDHPVHIMPSDTQDVTGTLLDSVHIIDPGQQAVKINQNSAKTHSANLGIIRNSIIELTNSGRIEVWKRNGSCYTGGIDAHHATGWKIENNHIKGFWCAGGLSEHGVHFWSDSRDTLVQSNTILECDRGIGFGLGSRGHQGGIIRNNMIYHGPDTGHSDVGIGLESASGASIYNNTIIHEHAYPNAIEYRFESSQNNYIANNLTNRAISSRNGGQANLLTNITEAENGWFTNPSIGDLHLSGSISAVVNRGTAIPGLLVDFDGDSRPQGSGYEIGADELVTTQQAPITGQSVSGALILLLKE